MNIDIRELLKAGVQDIFMQAYGQYDSGNNYAKIASIIPSTKDSETYAWLGDSPTMREFIGEREIKTIGEEKFSLANKTWESTIGVRRETLDDDQYGQIRVRIEDLAFEAAQHKDKLVFGLLNNGTSTPCWDGKTFFATNHAYTSKGSYKTAQSNTGTAELSKEALQDAITNMMNLKRSSGEPAGITPDTLIVPPALAWTGRELLESAYNPSSTGGAYAINPLQGSLRLIVSAYISNPKSWFVACTTRPVKPIIFQERQGIEFTALEGQSENGFMRNEYTYGVSARYNVGPGLWQLIFGSYPA